MKAMHIITLALLVHQLCYSGFNAGQLAVALFHQDAVQTKQQLRYLTPKNQHQSQKLICMGIQHPHIKEDETTSSFMIAAFRGNINTLTTLLARDSDINQCNNCGRTALMFAALGNQYKAIEFLIAHGAQTNIKDKHKNTCINYITFKTKPFIDAVLKGRKELIELYMPKNHEIKSKHGSRRVKSRTFNKLYKQPKDEKITPLIALAAKPLYDHAERQYYANLVGMLMSRGININKTSYYEKTPLMYATLAGNGLMIQALRESSADIQRRDSTGKTFRDHALGKEKLIKRTAAQTTPERQRRRVSLPLDDDFM